jgi:hypothetical protein
MTDKQNNKTDRVFEVPDGGIEPRRVRYIDPVTESQFRKSALPNNSSILISDEQEDRSIFYRTVAIILILIILAICLIRLENTGKSRTD